LDLLDPRGEERAFARVSNHEASIDDSSGASSFEMRLRRSSE
jgi:hypothetical protein